jgi:hypothetical protein
MQAARAFEQLGYKLRCDSPCRDSRPAAPPAHPCAAQAHHRAGPDTRGAGRLSRAAAPDGGARTARGDPARCDVTCRCVQSTLVWRGAPMRGFSPVSDGRMWMEGGWRTVGCAGRPEPLARAAAAARCGCRDPNANQLVCRARALKRSFAERVRAGVQQTLEPDALISHVTYAAPGTHRNVAVMACLDWERMVRLAVLVAPLRDRACPRRPQSTSQDCPVSLTHRPMGGRGGRRQCRGPRERR